jgi:hypothetical protein
MSDYSTNDPKGWCGDPSRGAALGRPTILGAPQGVLTVRSSPLDRQGYDRNGTYFGSGLPLFWFADEGGEVDAMERAVDAEDLAKVLRERFPGTEVKVAEALALPCWGHGDDACPNGADADDDYGDLCEECEWAEREEEETDEG